MKGGDELRAAAFGVQQAEQAEGLCDRDHNVRTQLFIVAGNTENIGCDQSLDGIAWHRQRQ